MPLHDARGVAVSTDNRQSLRRYEWALGLLHSYFNDPLAVIDEALAEDPDFVLGHCFRAGLLTTTTDKAAEPMLRESVQAGEALAAKANDRERRHLAAARAWLDGEFERAVALYGSITIDYPRDSLALQVAHIGDFLLGQSSQLRDRIARVLVDWDDSVPGYGYVLGMHAFGLEEMGDYGRAEERGRRALELNPRDPWAVHAVAHVMEMQGRLSDGIHWLTSRTDDWAPENGFAFHNWWHLALYHLDLDQHDRVLEIYDTGVRPKSSELPLEMLDASALLWRLHLRGVAVGDRWAELADVWEKRTDDAYYTFNDMHAMMSFVATGRETAARRLLELLVRRCEGGGTNAMMTRDVGLPVCRAIHAFGRGDYRTVIDELMPVRPIASRFGGSHAQRDVLSLTLTEAAMRGNDARLARALASERTEWKPSSPFSWSLTARARELVGDADGAGAARVKATAAREKGRRAA
ncbi:MAG: tetratricopeptide repeat protein [Dongiaceae bacterium]